MVVQKAIAKDSHAAAGSVLPLSAAISALRRLNRAQNDATHGREPQNAHAGPAAPGGLHRRLRRHASEPEREPQAPGVADAQPERRQARGGNGHTKEELFDFVGDHRFWDAAPSHQHAGATGTVEAAKPNTITDTKPNTTASTEDATRHVTTRLVVLSEEVRRQKLELLKLRRVNIRLREEKKHVETLVVARDERILQLEEARIEVETILLAKGPSRDTPSPVPPPVYGSSSNVPILLTSSEKLPTEATDQIIVGAGVSTDGKVESFEHKNVPVTKRTQQKLPMRVEKLPLELIPTDMSVSISKPLIRAAELQKGLASKALLRRAEEGRSTAATHAASSTATASGSPTTPWRSSCTSSRRS